MEREKISPMSKNRKIVIAAVFAVLVLLVGFLASVFLNPTRLQFANECLRFVSDVYSVGKEKAALRKPNVYMPFGEALALYCQSFPSLQAHLGMKDIDRIIFSDDKFSNARLPKIFAREPFVTYVIICEGEANTRYQGGFLDFGYELDWDYEASLPAENVWQLRFHSDGESRHLATIRMDPNRQLTRDEMLEIAAVRRDAASGANPATTNMNDDESGKGN